MFVYLILPSVNLLHVHDMIFQFFNVTLENWDLVILRVLFLINLFLSNGKLSSQIKNLQLQLVLLLRHVFVCLGHCVLKLLNFFILKIAHIGKFSIKFYLNGYYTPVFFWNCSGVLILKMVKFSKPFIVVIFEFLCYLLHLLEAFVVTFFDNLLKMLLLLLQVNILALKFVIIFVELVDLTVLLLNEGANLNKPKLVLLKHLLPFSKIVSGLLCNRFCHTQFVF